MAQSPPSSSADLVLILQFSERVPPAGVRTFLDTHHLPFHLCRVDSAYDVAAYEAAVWRAIVVLGGPQGAYEEERFPYLATVKRLLTAQLQRAAPILGICLGCQILADGRPQPHPPPLSFTAPALMALHLTDCSSLPLVWRCGCAVIGGQAYKSERPELGYAPMTASEVGAADPLISALLPYVSAGLFLNHHGDSFTLPPAVPVLLSSSSHPQAFRYRSAVAVQFHPEAGLEEFSEWLEGDSEERMRQVGRSKEQLLQEVKDKAAQATVATRYFFELWWREVDAKERTAPTAAAPQLAPQPSQA